MNNRTIVLSLLIVTILAFTPAILAADVSADSTKTAVTVADSLALLESLNDGPHVYRESDSSVIVFYLCHGSIEKRQLFGTDTVTFNGFCRDSGAVYTVPMSPPAERPCEIDNVPRIFAVSDIHGEYEAFFDILFKGGVIDEGGHWVWGDGHLVINGDVFDRGNRVTECLWFIYRLQQEARRVGGDVHFLLGNHELMVLRGDNRYVHERYLDGIARKSRIRHEDLYGTDMVLGRWLRTLPTAIRLNNVLFVHAGISPELLGYDLSITDLNRAASEGLDISSAELAFSDRVKFLFGGKGPFWYRGYHYAMENRYLEATDDGVDSIRQYYGVENIVVGHTGVDHVVPLYNGKVYAIDVPLEDIGTLEALLWQAGTFYRVTGTGDLEPLD
jgi:hypothetical protein